MRAFRCSGVEDGAGSRPPAGSERSSARTGTAAPGSATACAEQRLELGELDLGRVAAREPGRALELLEHRPERDCPCGAASPGSSAASAARSRSRSRKASTSRDLPIPGSPLSSTTCPLPALASPQRSVRSASSCSRPTSGKVPPVCRASNRSSTGFSPSTRKAADRLGDALQPLRAEVLELE